MDCESTDAVISGDVTLAAPESSAANAATGALPRALFQFQINRNNSATTADSTSHAEMRPTKQKTSVGKASRTQAI